MQKENIEKILSSLKLFVDHPSFYPRVFALAVKKKQVGRETSAEVLSSMTTLEYEELSRRLDRSQIQESCSVRNVLRTRRLARLLINNKGQIDLSVLPPVISYLQAHLYSLGPDRQYDGPRQEHILKVLKLLNTRKDLILLISKITRPLSNKWAEDLIRQTLQLNPSTVVTDAHTKQAVLSAWLCYLRQNVGSCFATAPAEIIHDEQPENFLQDLIDLIATGHLKRTFGGIENSVPLSASWGSGDLKKPLLIQQTSQEILPEIWYSPGLIAAFESVEMLNREESTKDKVHQVEIWIKSLVKMKGSSSLYVLTADEIIRWVLLQFMELTEKQIKEYENRPQNTIPIQLISVIPPMSQKKTVGVNERCAQFFGLFEKAKNVFKSLSDNALLKAWEFTLASFSDIKYELARWNFYASLGLENNQVGGIGQCIYQIIQEKVDQANRKSQDIQSEYEVVYTQLKTYEARMRHVSSEKEAQWLKAEYQSHRNEFYFLEEQRDAAQYHASSLVNLYESLYSLYVELFKDYFQEVYDADMQEVTGNPFDDSPAGFRLVYKHGRSNTSQWTRIKNQQEFIDALTSFFIATEPQIAHSLIEKKIEKDLSDVVTGIITHIKTREFLETAFHRMAAAHRVPLIKDPLEHLDQVEKKPWVYTSGGTMNTLVSCYYRIEEKPKEVEKWVENEMELLVFFADTLKSIPFSFMDPFAKGKRSSLLMQSPTHAFLLKPMMHRFREAWSSDEYTYTFIRDRFVRPAEMFVENILLTDEMIRYLVLKISEKIPENFRPRFKMIGDRLSGPLNPIFFREQIVDALENDRGLRSRGHSILALEEIDALLYSSLPFCPVAEIKHSMHRMLSSFSHFSPSKIDQVVRLYDNIPYSQREFSFVTAQQLQNICKALLCLSEASTTSSFDYHYHMSLAAQNLELAMPTPIIFADTNWVKNLFGFAINPGTGKLELWRLDYTGSVGYPMKSWKQWLDGSKPDLRWGIYIKPFQYGQN